MVRIITGAEIVVQALMDQGVDTVFGYPGGAVLPIRTRGKQRKKHKRAQCVYLASPAPARRRDMHHGGRFQTPLGLS